MVSRAQIASLQQRIERLAPQGPWIPKVARFIFDPKVEESQETAKQKHLAAHPEDRDADVFIVVTLVDPSDRSRQGTG